MKNPSFEQYQVCPGDFVPFSTWQVDGWRALDYSLGFYANSCANLLPWTWDHGVPLNGYGFQDAKSGNAYAGITPILPPTTIKNFRQYLQGSLMSSLKKDSLYCVSYWVSLSNHSYGAIKNIDAYLNGTLLNWASSNPWGYDSLLPGINPQIKSDRILSDTLNWMEVKGIYKAQGGENYITIGNFKDDANTTLIDFNNIKHDDIRYYVDEVAVTPFLLKMPDLGNDTMLCNDQLPIILTAPVGYDSLKWSDGTRGSTLSVNMPGKYWLTCIADGCGKVIDTITIKTYPTQKLQLINDTILCKGVSLVLQGSSGFDSYNWNTGSTSDNIQINAPGNYVLTAKDYCTEQKDSVRVSYDSLPEISIRLGENINICMGGVNQPYSLYSNYSNLLNYEWNNGEKSSSIIVSAQGDYFFISRYRCGMLYSDTVFVQECYADTSVTIYIPNAFTPNENGLNDKWHPIFLNHTIVELFIYNSWGEKIFTGTKENFYSWDGTYKDIMCQQGIYAYTITYHSSKQEESHKKYKKTGMICLIRGD